jgi:hypothetical protein
MRLENEFPVTIKIVPGTGAEGRGAMVSIHGNVQCIGEVVNHVHNVLKNALSDDAELSAAKLLAKQVSRHHSPPSDTLVQKYSHPFTPQRKACITHPFLPSLYTY